VSYQLESAFAEALVSSTLKDLRLTGESLNQATTVENSKELRSDRQLGDVVRTMVAAQGGLSCEMSYGTYDDLFLGAQLAAAWSSAVTVGPVATISASAADNSFNDSANGFGGILVNQWIKASGFTNAANNGIFKVVSVTAAKIVVKGGTLVTEAAAAGRKVVMGEQIVNGVAKTSFYIERGYTDLTNVLAGYKGMMVNNWNLDVKADQIITAGFEFLGSKETDLTGSLGTGYTPAPTNEVMAGVDDVFAVCEGKSAAMAVLNDVNNFSFQIQNNLRNRLRVGTLGAFSIGAGTINGSGTVQMYFSTSALMQKYLNFTETALAFPLLDSGGNGYVFDFPAVKFNRGQRVAGGQNTDIMADMGFMIKRDATEGITLRIARFPGP
jgi:hypothetical protein